MTEKEWEKFEENQISFYQTIKYQFLWALGLVRMEEFRGFAVALGYPPSDSKEDMLGYDGYNYFAKKHRYTLLDFILTPGKLLGVSLLTGMAICIGIPVICIMELANIGFEINKK